MVDQFIFNLCYIFGWSACVVANYARITPLEVVYLFCIVNNDNFAIFAFLLVCIVRIPSNASFAFCLCSSVSIFAIMTMNTHDAMQFVCMLLARLPEFAQLSKY